MSSYGKSINDFYDGIKQLLNIDLKNKKKIKHSRKFSEGAVSNFLNCVPGIYGANNSIELANPATPTSRQIEDIWLLISNNLQR
jgi:hypothetical protein